MRAIAAKQLIERRYAIVHGAVPAADYPYFCVVDPGDAGEPKAALGYRIASEDRLFLEDYLDFPIEKAVSHLFGRVVERDRIVEIGAHASDRSRATVALWARTARHLDGVADVAVAVLTAPLRSMFARLGIEIREICPADPLRLPGGAAHWGQYYAQRPAVCAGLISPARPKLAGFDDGITGLCA
nr:thermostable hemolysin [uncultured Sphingomonas sp.]